MAGWRLIGYSAYVVASPSMCPRICVGALVLDVPPSAHPFVGEVVSFVPPGLSDVYTHRITAVLANGDIFTRGDAANVNDPWHITSSMIRGRMVIALVGLGWLDLALPFLAGSLALFLTMRRFFARSRLRDLDRLASALLVAIPIWRLRPLVRGLVVTANTFRPGVSQLVVVNTGLLPAQFVVPHGQRASFVAPGHRVSLTGAIGPAGQLRLGGAASFHWWGWMIVIFFVASPMLWYVASLLRLPSRLRREDSSRLHWNETRPANSSDVAVASATKTSPRSYGQSHPFVRD